MGEWYLETKDRMLGILIVSVVSLILALWVDKAEKYIRLYNKTYV